MLMQLSKFTSKLSSFTISSDTPKARGEAVLLKYLAYYFFNHVVSYHDGDPDINNYLARHIVEAFDRLQYDEDPFIIKYRKQFLQARERDTIPELTEIEFGGLDRWSTIRMIKDLLNKVTDDKELSQQVENYLMAQDTVLEQSFHTFLRQVYRQGMYDLIDNCKLKGMSGKFGKTTLRSFCLAGRVMMTFATQDGKLERSVTFVGDDRDQTGKRFGVQSVEADLTTALKIIDEVVIDWPENNKEQQQKIFQPDHNISMG